MRSAAQQADAAKENENTLLQLSRAEKQMQDASAKYQAERKDLIQKNQKCQKNCKKCFP